MTLSADEFLRGFPLHVLPAGFVRILHFGFLANRTRAAKLTRCQALLAARPPTAPARPGPAAVLLRRVTRMDIGQCPVCHARRLRVVVSRPGRLPAPALDTSCDRLSRAARPSCPRPAERGGMAAHGVRSIPPGFLVTRPTSAYRSTGWAERLAQTGSGCSQGDESGNGSPIHDVPYIRLMPLCGLALDIPYKV
jgi:hypothetical protein